MGWANASYLPSVLSTIGMQRASTGRRALALAAASLDLDPESREALRRYSASTAAGCEDGADLNAAIRAGTPGFETWTAAMDGAFAWTFPHDVLLWRGGEIEDGGPGYVSTSLLERTARRFKDRSASPVHAILLRAGTKVAVPSLVWETGDDARTLGVVAREMEVVLPRGTSFEWAGRARPFQDRPGGEWIEVSCCIAAALTLVQSMRR